MENTRENNSTQQTTDLPSAKNKTLGKKEERHSAKTKYSVDKAVCRV